MGCIDFTLLATLFFCMDLSFSLPFLMEWHLEFHHSSFVNFCRCCLFMSYMGYSGWTHFSPQRNWFSLDCDFMVMWVVAKSIEQLCWSERGSLTNL